MNEQNAASRFDQLDETVKDMLRKLEPDEVENLKYIATIPKGELRAMMKFFRDGAAVTRFGKWLLFGGIAMILLGSQVSDAAIKIVSWFRGAGPAP